MKGARIGVRRGNRSAQWKGQGRSACVMCCAVHRRAAAKEPSLRLRKRRGTCEPCPSVERGASPALPAPPTPALLFRQTGLDGAKLRLPLLVPGSKLGDGRPGACERCPQVLLPHPLRLRQRAIAASDGRRRRIEPREQLAQRSHGGLLAHQDQVGARVSIGRQRDGVEVDVVG
eukprot:scaffold3033_cov101-Isochrysis_galbana.AAC.1